MADFYLSSILNKCAVFEKINRTKRKKKAQKLSRDAAW